MPEQDPFSRDEHEPTVMPPEMPEQQHMLGDQPDLRTQGEPWPPFETPAGIFYFIPASYTLGVSVVTGLANASPEFRIGSSAFVGICAVGLLNLLDRQLD